MIIELIRKEFLARRDVSNKSLLSAILSWLLRIILLGGFVALEVFIALSIDRKITQYSSYGTYDFLVFFLFVAMVVGVLYTTVRARAVIFDDKESAVILPLPVSSSDIVLSKIIYLYIQDILLELLVASPLLVCYGATRGFDAHYYVFAILYPIIISLFSVGISLLLSVGYQYIYKLIKQSDIAQFIVASLLVVALCYLYQFVLNMFLVALGDSSVGGVFSDEFINAIHNAANYFYPVKNILLLTLYGANIGQNIAILAGMIVLSAVLGIGSCSIVYNRMMKLGYTKDKKKKDKEKPMKVVSPAKALLKKEMDLLFKDETNMFSYTSLLIMAPFLTFVVISSLNGVIFDDLKFYAAYFPELISAINLALVLLFAGIINSSASLSMSREKKCMEIVKYLPVSIMRQVTYKLTVPVIFSEGSFLVTLVVLIATSSISWQVLVAAFIIGTMMILWNNAFGLYADMHDHSSAKGKLGVWNNIVPIILPIVLLASHFLITTYTTLPVLWVYIIEIAFVGAVFAPFFIKIGSRYEKAFRRMEVRV